MEQIPLVDFSALSLLVSDENIDESAAQRTSDQLLAAFATTGFVYLSNTAFPKGLVSR
jgi:isopenicillin N synthase-like dioxygenase